MSIASFDETRWVKSLQQTLAEEAEEDDEIPVTIFGVPKALLISDPDSYIPQQVAIGPYHHLRIELYDMERYKIAAAKRNQKSELQNVKLKVLVDHLIKLESRIRSSYHRPLSFGGEALAWIMAVDVSFIFEFLQVCAVREGKAITRIPSRMAHLIDLSGNKTAHNAILRDIIMLENQIPLFVMKKLLELQFSSHEMAEERLFVLLSAFSSQLSPFKMVEIVAVSECAHLLEFLYNFIVPKSDRSPVVTIEIDVEEGEEKKEGLDEEEEQLEESSHVKQLRGIVTKILSGITKKPLQWIKRVLLSKPIKLVVKLPWKIVSHIPILKAFKQPVENMFTAYNDKKDDGDGDEEAGAAAAASMQKPPLQEEISIPSVTQLLEAGVRFMPTNSGISSFAFDSRTLTLHIPVIKLDVNSEAVLRNLVAYEACMASGPLVLTRYTELMNGIIDTDVDAKLLCQRGIIVNHLKSDKEVADLWNGMSKSVRLTKVPSLDMVIADVNRFYNDRWRVRCRNYMREYVFGSWRILTFIAAVVMVALMTMQAFCQVYSCHRLLKIDGLMPGNE